MRTITGKLTTDKGRRTMPDQQYSWFHDVLLGALTPYQLAVYLVLAKHADEKQDAWPSQKTIAKLAHCSLRQVQLALDSLEALNLIARRLNPPASGRKYGVGAIYTLLHVDAADLHQRVTSTRTTCASPHAPRACTTRTTCVSVLTRPIEQDPVNKTGQTRTAPAALAENARSADGEPSRHPPVIESSLRSPGPVVTLLSPAQISLVQEFDSNLAEALAEGKTTEAAYCQRYAIAAELWRRWKDSLSLRRLA
jgi:helix-turn-helix protein